MGNGGDDKKIKSPETEDKYLDKSAEMFSRDLLQSFLGSTCEHETMKEAEQEEEIELNLGLSLGGRFGLEPKNLLRSSSTASFLPMERDVSDTSPSTVAAKSSLARTSSMPVETEDERRKRKELQSLRRMEAKRRRSEKKRAVKGDKEMEVDWMWDLEREKHFSVMKKLDIPIGRPVLEASSNLGGGIDVVMAKGKGVSAWGSGGIQGFGQVLSQGSSMESSGQSSSSLMGTKMSELSVEGTDFEASSNLGGGIDAAMAKGKGVSAWGGGGIQGFWQVLSQGSSMVSSGQSSSSLMGTKMSELSVGGTVFEASSNLGGGIDVAIAKGKGVSAWGSGGMQGFGQVLSQGSSMESTGKSSSSLMMTKKSDLSIGGTVFETSTNLGGGIDVVMAKGKGVSAWGSGGMQGFGQVGPQGSSIETTGKSSSSLMGDLEREKHLPVMNKSDLSVGGPVFEASSNLGGEIDSAMAKGKGVSALGSGGMQGFGQVLSQGSSVESTGGSSSSLSDLESKALQGSSGELSPASTLSLRERSKLDVGSSKTEAKENLAKASGSVIQSSAKPPVDTSRTGDRDTRTSAVEDMPSVYTRGDGLSGRRVDGILYRYGRGEEVRIMCICHGIFHSPAEFVLHAGGTNVDNPLRRIVINPNSSPLL